MSESDEKTDDSLRQTGTVWPWYVRWLAVAFVWSQLVGPLGFFVGATLAAVLVSREGLGTRAIIAMLVALGCPLACAMFRKWFKHWGQTNWPSAD